MDTAAAITTGIAAFAAVAAAMSAASSARGVALGHRPYVYGERASATADSGSVRLRNDGPGTATEVRWRVTAPGAQPTDWSEIVRAMQPSEVYPPEDHPGDPTSLPVGVDGHAFGWYVETEYSDIRGARWRLANVRGGEAKRIVPRRIRSGRLIDGWRRG